jgi:Protein of unknown function (DUF4231)
MNSFERLECLKRDIENLVTRYQAEAHQYKNQAFRLRIVSVVLASIITMLLGLKLDNGSMTIAFSNIALVLSSAITVLSAYEAFFDPRSLWVRETVTFARLKDLQRDLRFWSAGQDPEAIDMKEVQAFKLRLDAILDETLKYWMKIKGAPDLEQSLKARAELGQKGP